jgi:hypothetical protein
MAQLTYKENEDMTRTVSSIDVRPREHPLPSPPATHSLPPLLPHTPSLPSFYALPPSHPFTHSLPPLFPHTPSLPSFHTHARTAPHRTAPHRTAPHRTAPHRTAPHSLRINDTKSHMDAHNVISFPIFTPFTLHIRHFGDACARKQTQETVSTIESDCAKQREACNSIIEQLAAITKATEGLTVSVTPRDAPDFTEWQSADWTDVMSR